MSRGSSAGAAFFIAGLVGILALASGCSETSMVVAPVPTVSAPTDQMDAQVPRPSSSASTTTIAPASTTVAPVPTTTEPAPTSVVPTTTLAGGPIPDATPGFCAELAIESGELILQVERVLPADGQLDPMSQRTLLLATRNLLAWTNNRVPPGLRGDVGLLNRVYADLGIELDGLDVEMVTMPRLQALVFTYVLDSPVVDAVELDLSARRLAAFVDRSCGQGFPIMESMADLFALD
ncbi:MAG: hypothetical protein MK196_09555 [Acidimicrobiales bacterium]|nr:hypothetical protein [Acidimicrobiales bacterium]